ncbi:DUF4282 domain-containing protein [Allorhodopirellula solitaria]|nr:DUF4282 domain-containing protein [Allorhodopirellula solitaria]
MLKHHDGEIHGPYTMPALVDAAKVGSVAEDSEVMHEMHTRGQWVAVGLIRPIALAIEEFHKNIPPSVDSPPHAFEFNEDGSPGGFVQASANQHMRKSDFRPSIPTTFLDACWGLIDFRFQTYVTPWIIRVYWVFAIILTVLSLIFGAASVVTYPFRDGSPRFSNSSPQLSIPQNRDFDSIYGDSNRELEQPDEAGNLVGGVIHYIVSIAFAIIFLISIRLVLETGIVVFCIAEDVRAVRENTT